MNKKRTVLMLVTLLVFGAIIALHYITPNIFEYFRFRGGGGGGTDLGWVNVKNAPYNATGDGITDDTAAIQSAINAVGAAGGGVVFFPKGVYLCNGAFDATTNSILKFPYYPIQTAGVYNNPVVIELRGQLPTAIGGASVLPVNASIIKSTKTGTGTAPAILAAYTFSGRTFIPDFATGLSYVQPVIRNMQFHTGVNPTIYGVRLDTAVNAIIEDVVITTTDGAAAVPTEPTHSTAGLCMPTTQNFGTSYCNRVWVAGFDTGMLASTDHFRAPQANFLNCHVAVEFVGGAQLGWGNFMVDHCNTAVKFTPIGGTINKGIGVLNLDIEQVNSGWQLPAAGGDILDSSNIGLGEIRYYIDRLSVGTQPIGVTGGTGLRLINAGDIWPVYVGADLRLVPITGGGKLQARNPGTNTWADVDQWTNP
jgi:hypothetical protein